jgi:hypothetical protein
MSGNASGSFRLEVIYPRSFFDKTPSTIDISGLNYIGLINGGEAYASQDLVTEVIAIRALGGLHKGDVYHATSSVALPAISRQKALLSSRRLIKEGESLVTGEITTPQGRLHKEWNGLEDVYASASPHNVMYAKTKEDEYPVIFGIDAAPFTMHAGLGDYGDGIKLGPTVPLSHVNSMAVPHERVSEANTWSQENCRSDTLVLSLQAAMVLNLCSLEIR